MSHGHNQLDVSHTLTTYFFLGHFNTATVANDPFVTDPLVFTAMAFEILNRTEDALAEKSITLRLIGCLLYTSDAADERSSVDLGGRRIIKKKKRKNKKKKQT